MSHRKKSNSTSSPPPSESQSSHKTSAAAVASSESCLPGLRDRVAEMPMEQFEQFCRSAVEPSYGETAAPPASRFSVPKNPVIAAQSTTLGAGADGSTRPESVAIPIDTAGEERAAVADSMSSQAHLILSQLKTAAVAETQKSDAQVDRSLKSAGLTLATGARLNKSSSQDCCVGLARASPNRPQSVPPAPLVPVSQHGRSPANVEAPPDFHMYLNRTEDVPRFVHGLKEQKLVSSDCKETHIKPASLGVKDDFPFIDDGADVAVDEEARPSLEEGRQPLRNSIRLQDSAIVDSGPPANQEVELQEMKQDDADDFYNRGRSMMEPLNPTRREKESLSTMPAAFFSPPNLFNIDSGGGFSIMDADAFTNIRYQQRYLADQAQQQQPNYVDSNEKKKEANKERRARLARKNIKEEKKASEIEGNRGNEGIDSLMSFIEGSVSADEGAAPHKRPKKIGKAVSESGAVAKRGKAKGKGKASPDSSAAVSQASDASSPRMTEDEDLDDHQKTITANHALARFLKDEQEVGMEKVLDTTDVRLFASDSYVTEVLLARNSAASPLTAQSEGGEFKVVEKKKVKKAASTLSGTSRPPPFPRSASSTLSARGPRPARPASKMDDADPEPKRASTPPPQRRSPAVQSGTYAASAARVGQAVNVDTQQVGRKLPAAPLSAPNRHSPTLPTLPPSTAEDWPLIGTDEEEMGRRRQSVDELALCNATATTSAWGPARAPVAKAPSQDPVPSEEMAKESSLEPANSDAASVDSSIGRPSWASVASKPQAQRQTTSLQTSRTSSPSRHRASVSGYAGMLGGRRRGPSVTASAASAASTNAANASTPDLNFIAGPPEEDGAVFNDDDPPLPSKALRPLDTYSQAGDLAGTGHAGGGSLTSSALVSPPLPPHPLHHANQSPNTPPPANDAQHCHNEEETKKTWANIAATARPTAVVKPQQHSEQSEVTATPRTEELNVTDSTVSSETPPTSQSPPPEEPQPPVAAVPVMAAVAEETLPGPGQVQFAFPSSEPSSEGTSDDETAGFSFGNFSDIKGAEPIGRRADSATSGAGGISFGDFGNAEETAVEAAGKEAAEAPGVTALMSGLSQLAVQSSLRRAEDRITSQLRRHFEISIKSEPKIMVYKGGRLVEQSTAQ